MSELRKQISDHITKHRRSVTITASDDMSVLLALAEEIRTMSGKCLEWPTHASIAIAFLLLRLREGLQSTVLLLSHGLTEDAITINRKTLEMCVGFFDAIITGDWKELRQGAGKFKRFNMKDTCSRLPKEFGDMTYELYGVLSSYSHFSSTIANTTIAELPFDGDPSQLGVDVDTSQWPHTLSNTYVPFIQNLIVPSAENYIRLREEGLENYRLKALVRFIVRLGLSNKHPKMLEATMDAAQEADPQAAQIEVVKRFMPALVQEGVLNEDMTPGSVMLAELSAEFLQVAKVWDSSKVSEIEAMLDIQGKEPLI